jgi:hypothetical protein
MTEAPERDSIMQSTGITQAAKEGLRRWIRSGWHRRSLAIDGSGNVGIYFEGGLGAGFGFRKSGGLTVTGSNANQIDDLVGPFAGGSIGRGAGAAGSINYAGGASRNGSPITNGGVTLGGGGGAGVSATSTYNQFTV